MLNCNNKNGKSKKALNELGVLIQLSGETMLSQVKSDFIFVHLAALIERRHLTMKLLNELVKYDKI